MFRRLRGSFRARLFTAMFLLVCGVVASLGLYAQTTIKARLRANLDQELERYARAAREVLEARRPALSRVDLDALADEAGTSLGIRVSFIDAEGQVLGDSRVALPELAELDNHATRPEVRGALAGQVGKARRFSRTLGEDLEYVALAFEYDALDGSRPILIARVALPVELGDAPVDELTRAIWFAGIVALGLAAALAAWLTSVLSARFRSLAEQVRGAARLQDERSGVDDEVAHVAGSFGQLSATLEATVKTLANERDHFGAVLDSLGEAVLAVDAAWKVETVNAAARAMFSLSGAVVGRPIVEVARVPEVAEWTEHEGGVPVADAEFRIGTGSAARLVAAECFPRAEGRGAVLVFRDVTELRKLETVRTDFVANVSHELRTPISVISGAAQTLETAADELPPPLPRFVEKIQRNADRLGRLVSDLLDLSRIEARRGSAEQVSVDLRRSARTVIASLAAFAAEEDTELVNRIPEGLTVVGDAGAIEQIFTNLVENAIKYAGGDRVELWASRVQGEVRFGVDDKGVGIADTHIERLFERFYRVDPGRSRDMGGTGLGLAIVKHLAESMGATATASRKPEGGMRFEIVVPDA